jgi:nitroreductase
LFGFCQREQVDKQGIITFFYDKKEEVDWFYEKFKEIAISEPSVNQKYGIYQFFTKDPEGRKLEFQYFDYPVDRYLGGDELLVSRRSVRDFKEEKVPQEILDRVLHVSRFSPTSRNSQSYYFKFIRKKELLKSLSKIRGESSAPIKRAPMAVAICSDPDLTRRHVEDGCIAAYHFMLASWFFGLGTCWIGGMDREEVKKILEIPENHYVATVTPLGYPERLPLTPPDKREISWFIR